MNVVRLPLNEYALLQVRNLERLSGLPANLGDQLAAEIGKPPRAMYLGAFDDSQELVGVARLITETQATVLLDALEVQLDSLEYEGIETLLLDAADALAAQAGKSLAVIADAGNTAAWTELGFKPKRNALLTLTHEVFDY